MTRTKLTLKFLNSLTNTTGKPIFHRDSELPGFGVKVTPLDRVVFIAEGRIKGGKTKRVTIGNHPVIKLDKARELAQDALLVMKQGDDPIELGKEEREQKARAAALVQALSVTLRSVFDDFKKGRDHKPRTAQDYRNTVNLCFIDWLDQPIRSITRKDVEERFFKIKKDAGKPQAAKAMRYLSAIMNYAKADEIEGQRLIVENPCEVLKDKKIDRRIKPRTRYLEKEELRDVVDELSHVHHPEYKKQKKRITNPAVADYLTLLLFTGLRKVEAASLEWSNVKLGDKLFSIEDTKNGETHVVPMSGPVEEMLQRRFEDKKKHPQWVFPAKRGDGHLVEPRKQIELIGEITGVHFTSHDLRRTFATLAESYGLDYQTIKRALNHKSQDITAQYIQTRAAKMRHAFDAIAEEIMWWSYDEKPESKMSDEEKLQRDEAMKPVDLEAEEDGYIVPSE
jgi:integrase